MTDEGLSIDFYAYVPPREPSDGIEARIIEFLESDPHSESLDGPAFGAVNRDGIKADYLLAERGIIAELKTINSDPKGAMEQRLKTRFEQPDAPIVFGTVGLSAVTKHLPDQADIDKMLVDIAGRAVRRHMKKANDQIAAIKARLDLPSALGLLILMSEREKLIDAGAIAYAVKSSFETAVGGYPHINHVLILVESHKVALPRGRKGLPVLMMFRRPARQAELNFVFRMMNMWAIRQGAELERIVHHGDWSVLAPMYVDGPPTLSPFD